MKKIILAVAVLMISSITLADSPFLQYEFGMEHKGDEYYVSLRLFENTDMSIEVRPIEEAGAQILNPDIFWTNIEPLLFEQLYAGSKTLSQEKTEKLFNHFVCELYVPYAMQVNHLYMATPYDPQAQQFSSVLEPVKGPEGCWVKNTVFFTEEENNEKANDLKMKLRNWFQQSALMNQLVVVR